MNRIRALNCLVLVACSFAGFTLLSPAGYGQDNKIPKPDLVVTQLAFEKVRQGTDASGHTYWIFNVIVSVKNQGGGAAAASKLLLERNNGAGGAYQQACATCLIDVAAIPAGGSVTLPPRQFNNADNAPSTFRATIDSQHTVAEANESNNSLTAEFKSPVLPALKPDLTVTLDFQNFTSSVSGGTTTWTFDVVATVKNLGPGSSPACDMVFQRAPITDPHGSVFINNGFRTVPALAPNAQVVISATGQTWVSGKPRWIYSVDVDYNGKVDETNETNNHAEKTTPWNAPAPAAAAIRPGA